MKQDGVPQVDIAVVGGTAVTPRGRETGPIGLRDGRIVQIGGAMAARETLDAKGCFVLPGAVDPHVHLSRTEDEPGSTFADTYTSGTRAALAGGATCVGQMSFPREGETMSSALAADSAGLAAGAACDYFLHPSIVYPDADTAQALPGFAADGHPSFKTTLFGLDATPDNSPDGARHLLEAMSAAASAGVVTMIHCEDNALIEHRTRELEQKNAPLSDYPRSRPVVSERAAVERAVAVAEVTGATVYVVHLSSREALEVARAARARGTRVLVETRPVYLYLTDQVHRRAGGERYTSMPPLRGATDAAALWAGLADGSIDTIGSDHAPWTLAQKTDPTHTLTTLPKGIAELDTYLPLLFDRGVLGGHLTLEQLVAVTATNPARIFGLTGKGVLEVGADADLVVIDPDVTRTVAPARLQTRAGYTPYDGQVVRGWPRFVISGGHPVVREGTLDAQPGRGRLARREPRPHRVS